MSSHFGFIDIILLAMFAGFIILRLRNILGRRTSRQHKPMGKYFPKGMEVLKDIENNEAIKTGNVNDATKEMAGDVIPTEISIYEDRSFDFKLKTPPAADLLKKAAGISKGSAVGAKKNVGKVTQADLKAIAERKMADLNAYNIDAAAKIIAGTAKNMGIEVVD